MANERAINVSQATQIARSVKGQLTNINGRLKEIAERYNWYDPSEPYKFVAANGETIRTQTTINDDGSWTSIANSANIGQVLYRSQNENRILPAGTYTLTARITLNENYSGTSIRAYCKIGLSSTNALVDMKTERGGNTNITAGSKIGWVKITQTTSEDGPFVFGIEVWNQTSSTLPYTVDYIQLNAGGVVLPYSTKLWDSGANAAQETANATRNVHIYGLNGAYPTVVGSNTVVFEWDGHNVYVDNINGVKTTISFESILQQLPTYATLNGNALSISIPNEGMFGYDTKNNCFVVYANHQCPTYVKPLYYRYYTIGFGELTSMNKIGGIDIDDSIYNSKRLIYTTSTSLHSWVAGTNGAVVFHVETLLILRLWRNSTYLGGDVTWESISSDISGSIIIDGKAADITVPNNCSLVYNTTSKLLAIRGLSTVSANHVDDIVLLKVSYGIPVGGILYDEYIDRNFELLKDNALKKTDIFNAEPYTGTYDWQTPVVEYGKLFKGKSNVEAFAFFTDPHTLGFADDNRNETKMENYFKRVQKVYNSASCSFLVCGGDWLNNSTTMDEACYRLGYLKGISKHLLDGCYLVKGNHDTNYQGKLNPESDNYTGRLTDATIDAIMYRDTNTKKAYYSFDGSNSKCYVLDSGIEHNTMLAYDWEQVSWLANQLKTDDPDHAIIFLHIIVSANAVQTNAGNFGALVQAFNSHSTVELNGVTYDFTACSGHVDFWVAGHTHTDSTGTLGGVPYFITASNAYTSDVPLIDLVLVDYDNSTLNLVRVGGTGDNRTIQLS